MEGMLHGLLLMGLSAVGAIIVLKPKTEGWLVFLLVTGAYASTAGATLGAAFDVLGLSPGGSVANTIDWALNGYGTVCVSIAVVMAGVGARNGYKEQDGPTRTVELPQYLGEPKHRAVVETENWHNWSGNRTANPVRIHHPDSLLELQQQVKQAYVDGFRIRAVGGGYSWSEMAETQGVMINVSNLNRPLGTEPRDGDKPATVTVESGMTVHEITEYAARSDLTFTNTTVIPFIEVGGATAMGCHGTGRDVATFSDLVCEMEVVGYDGSVTTYQRDDSDTWRALLVNLGALGIVYSLTFECVDMFNVHAIDKTANMADTIQNVKSIVTNNDYTELFWFPFNEDCLIKTWNRTTDKATEHLPQRAWDDLIQWIENDILGPAFPDLLAAKPDLTPGVARKMFAMMPKLDVVCPAPWAFQYQAAFVNVVDTSCAIPIDESFDKVKKAWQACVDKVAQYANRGEYPQNMVLHARFVGRESAGLLSPTAGCVHGACYISALTFAKTPGYTAYYRELEQDWAALGGKPHWGKLFYDSSELRKAYGENMDRYLKVREELDPKRVFVNESLDKILQLPK